MTGRSETSSMPACLLGHPGFDVVHRPALTSPECSPVSLLIAGSPREYVVEGGAILGDGRTDHPAAGFGLLTGLLKPLGVAAVTEGSHQQPPPAGAGEWKQPPPGGTGAVVPPGPGGH